VPLPMSPNPKIPVAAAFGVPTAAPIGGVAGSPLVIAPAVLAVAEAVPSSRRVTANAPHASAAAAGPSPLPPIASHESRLPPTPLTPPLAAAARGAVISGATAAAGAASASIAESEVAIGDCSVAATAALCSAGAGSVTVEEPGDAVEDGVIAPVVVSLITGEGSAVPDRSAEERLSRALMAVLGRDVVPLAAVRAPEAMLGAASLADESDVELGSESDESSGVVLSTAEELLVSDPLDESRAVALRDPRLGALVDSAPADEESEAFAPVEPAEPVVSAKAIGIDPIAEPTPNATASAPTRPTYRE